MAETSLQRISAQLRSDDFSTRLAALHELGKLDFSSPAILRLLEQLALEDPQATVRRIASAVLANRTHRLARAAISTLPQETRTQLLTEIDTWQADGLMPADQARILRQRYNFDLPMEQPTSEVASPVAPATPAPMPEPEPAPEPAAADPAPAPSVPDAPRPAAVTTPPAVAKAEPAKPEPSEPGPTLMQRLLSQATVNVFLYLGAFLVIGAALILAALVQAARLPILTGVAVVFAASAIVLKKRLPQPSFALFIVFSFLLPILAGVLGDSLNLSGRAVYAYWALVFLVMAASWAFSTWFYGSRLFSVASFLSLALGSVFFVRIFTDSADWITATAGLAALSGLAGTMLLRGWKGDKFATPLSIATQGLPIAVAAAAAGSAAVSLFNSHMPGPGEALAITLTWLLIAAFYVWSSDLHRFVLLPWLAAAALVPAAWWSPLVFGAGLSGFTAIYWVWAALLAAASEILARRDAAKLRRFSLPLILVSLVLFLSATISAAGSITSVQLVLVLAGAGLVYTGLHIMRTRALLWTTALLFGLAAYFIVFTLPLFQDRAVAAGYQWLGGTLLLMLPELFFRDYSRWRSPWRLPLLVLGVILASLNVALRFSEYLNDQLALFPRAPQPTAQLITFALYALLMLGYALHFRKPRLLYFATASAAFTALVALSPIHGTLWLPVLTGVSAAYYAGGLALRLREKRRGWGNVLRASSLWLGTLITAAALIDDTRLAAPYAVFIAALFFAEVYVRPDDRMELLGPLFLSAAAFLGLPHPLLAISLSWLLSDLMYMRTMKQRRAGDATRAIGAAAALTNVLAMQQSPTPHVAAFSFAIYAVLALIYALQFRRPWLAYLATACAAEALLYLLLPIKGTIWLPAFTALSLAYYAAGLILKSRERTHPWGNVLRISGLVLGAVITAAALSGFTRAATLYVVVIAALHFAELYLRPDDRLEPFGPLFLSAAAMLVLPHNDASSMIRLLLVISVIWLLVDLVYARTLKQRRLDLVTRAAGAALAVVNVLLMLVVQPLDPRLAALCFALYALLSLAYAVQFRRPALLYFATGSAAASLFFWISPIKGTLWLPVFTSLTVAYYAAGLVLRTRPLPPRWAGALRESGLALGTLVVAAALAGITRPGAPYAVVIAAMFFAEVYLRPDDRLELAGPLFLSAAAVLALPTALPDDISRLLLAVSLVWLLADVLYSRTLKQRRWSRGTRVTGVAVAMANSVSLLSGAGSAVLAAWTFGVYALFAAFDAWLYRKPELGYAAASFLPLSIFFSLRAAGQSNWLYAIVATAGLYYAAGYALRRRARAPRWSQILIYSGLGLATLNAVSAPLQTGLQAAIPVAIAATLFALEAFALRNAWLGFPANALYMEAYVLILQWLSVDQPQFYSVGAAVLGLTMHYLLTRAGSKIGAFITGMSSQLVLLGTSYIQLVSTENLAFFTAVFFQGLVVLAYGIVIRSRSLVIMPIIFIVISVITVIYSALKGLSTVILIGGAGILLLALGIAAVLLRERLIKFGDQWSTWKA